MTTTLELSTVLPRLNAALAAGKLLLVWGDTPFPPEAEAPVNAAAHIAQWQRTELPPVTWPLWETPPLPILSLEPTARLAAAFRAQGAPLVVVATRRDVPVAGQHSLLQLAGDLAARRGLWLAWADVRDVHSDPDKAYLLQEAARIARDGVVLVCAPDPGPAFARLWAELLAPVLREAEAVVALGPAESTWPAGIRPLAGAALDVLGQLVAPVAQPDTPVAVPSFGPAGPGSTTHIYVQGDFHGTIASGERSIAVGGDARDSTFQTGDTVAVPAAAQEGAESENAPLRTRLQRLDDVALDTLCMDHFPAVYDRFSRGLRRDEKVNLLLDHCRRNPEAAGRLAEVLQ